MTKQEMREMIEAKTAEYLAGGGSVKQAAAKSMSKELAYNKGVSAK